MYSAYKLYQDIKYCYKNVLIVNWWLYNVNYLNYLLFTGKIHTSKTFLAGQSVEDKRIPTK